MFVSLCFGILWHLRDIWSFQEITKRSEVSFCYSSRYSKLIEQVKKIWGIFSIVYACFLVFQSFCSFREYLGCYERSKILFCYLSRYFNVIGASQNYFRFFCIFYVSFLIFRPYLGVNIIFVHFLIIMKRSKVLFNYPS